MKTILWVEDEKTQFALYASFLQKKYKILHASTYAEAVQTVDEGKFDLLIVDLLLPSGMQAFSINDLRAAHNTLYGIELIKRVRQGGKNVPIVVLSIVSSGAELMRIQAIDKNIVLLNKYASTPEDIMKAVKELLGRTGH